MRRDGTQGCEPMVSGTTAARTATLLTAVLSGGCSWLFVTPPPVEPQHHGVLNCTTNQGAPVVDTVFTATNLGSVVYVLAQDKNQDAKASAVVVGLSVAAIWLNSAVYGFTNTSRCEELVARGYIPEPEPPVPPPQGRPPAAPTPQPSPPPASETNDSTPVSPTAPRDAPAEATPPPPPAPRAPQEEDDDDPSSDRGPRPGQPASDQP